MLNLWTIHDVQIPQRLWTLDDGLFNMHVASFCWRLAFFDMVVGFVGEILLIYSFFCCFVATVLIILQLLPALPLVLSHRHQPHRGMLP